MSAQELAGKVALVTGASSGIGRATAVAMARAGAKVALVARRRARLEELAQEIAREGGEALALAVDLRSAQERAHVIERCVAVLGGLDYLVQAAGVIGFGTVEDTPLEAWQQMFELNVAAPFHLTQLALPQLVARKGSVVMVSSVAGLRSFPGIFAYCASKAALDQLTRCAALELAPRGVRVNAVNPGVVRTELHRAAGMDAEKYQGFLAHSTTTHPLGRVAEPEEVAELILFLASERAGWITGATLPIDGGRHLTCAR